MDLTEALQLRDHEVVAFAGAGGKTTAVFRLCAEAVARGRKAVASGTARFSEPEGGAGMTAVVEEDEARLLEGIRSVLASENAVLAAAARFAKDRFTPISYEAVAALAAETAVNLVALEADGSRMRPFKAPAEHEPAVPPSATFVVVVVGADVFGRPLTDESVHRLERVLEISGAKEGDPITPELVTRVLADPEGGGKAVPAAARFAVLINKVDAQRLEAARETARLLRRRGVPLVVLAGVREAEPVVEVLG